MQKLQENENNNNNQQNVLRTSKKNSTAQLSFCPFVLLHNAK